MVKESELGQEIEELVQRVGDLEQRLKAEKAGFVELDSKFSFLQDENHQLLSEQKQVERNYKKYNEEMLVLRQELQEVSSKIILILI